jgi:hypothetical protein
MCQNYIGQGKIMAAQEAAGEFVDLALLGFFLVLRFAPKHRGSRLRYATSIYKPGYGYGYEGDYFIYSPQTPQTKCSGFRLQASGFRDGIFTFEMKV